MAEVKLNSGSVERKNYKLRDPINRQVSKSSIGSLPKLQRNMQGVSQEQIVKDAINMYFNDPERPTVVKQAKLPLKRVAK